MPLFLDLDVIVKIELTLNDIPSIFRINTCCVSLRDGPGTITAVPGSIIIGIGLEKIPVLCAVSV